MRRSGNTLEETTATETKYERGQIQEITTEKGTVAEIGANESKLITGRNITQANALEENKQSTTAGAISMGAEVSSPEIGDSSSGRERH